MSNFGPNRSGAASGTGVPTGAVPESLFTAKGDLIAGTSAVAGTEAKLAVGANDTRLVADSTQTTGLKWVADTVNKVVTVAGDIIYATAAGIVARLGIGTAGQPLVVNAGATAPQWGFDPQTANKVYAGPSSGGAVAPAFRSLVPADLSMTPITNSLSGDVSLSNTSNFFDGPSVAQGTAGTWFVSGTITLFDSVGGGANFNVKLWDGTTVIASSYAFEAASAYGAISLSGYISSPAGNLRISVKDVTATSGKIIFNQSGNSKDSTITAIRIA